MRELNRLITQAEQTLNFLRAARENPILSEYAYIFGQFDWNATPLVPLGTRVLAYDKSNIPREHLMEKMVGL